MWRQVLRRSTPTLLALSQRHATPARRLFSTTTPVHVAGARPAASPSAPEDDNFVDIDNLAGFSEADGAASPRLDPQPSIRSFSAPDMATSASLEVLGVIRHTPEDANARHSRLQIPLEPSEDGSDTALRHVHVRANTRAGLPFGEEARYADETAGGAAASAAEGDREAKTVEHKAAFRAQQQDEEVSEGLDEAQHLPNPSQLPYDDERFAEMLLQMEVDGVIDEAWQDTTKAHMEDVKEIADILASLKVRDLCCIDVSEKTSNFDYMMFGTCEGARHIHLAAWAVQDADKVKRISKIKRKQTDELWEVVPVGRIVVNLMVESFREEMTMERKWAVTRTMDPLAVANAPISEGRQVKSHGLWTLTLNLQDLEDFEVDYCKDVLMRQM